MLGLATPASKWLTLGFAEQTFAVDSLFSFCGHDRLMVFECPGLGLGLCSGQGLQCGPEGITGRLKPTEPSECRSGERPEDGGRRSRNEEFHFARPDSARRLQRGVFLGARPDGSLGRAAD